MLSNDIYENEDLLNDVLNGKLPINKKDLINIVNTWGRYTEFSYTDDFNIFIVEKQKPNGNLPLCDLNLSEIDDISDVFFGSSFNGDLSKWDFSKFKKMNFTFCLSDFNNDSLKYLDFKNIKYATYCFYNSKFCGDISGWKNYENTNLLHMFSFNKDFQTKYCFDNKIESYKVKQWLDENLERIREINRPTDDVVLDYFDFDDNNLDLER